MSQMNHEENSEVIHQKYCLYFLRFKKKKKNGINLCRRQC